MEYGLDMVKLAYMAGSYGRTMTKTKFFRTDEGPYFLTHGAPRPCHWRAELC